MIANLIDSQSLYGFLWLAAALRLLITAAIYGLVKELWPRATGFALAVALLYLISPLEPARYLALGLTGYFLYPTFLVWAALLFVRGYKRNQRVLLWASAIALAFSILGAEPGLPLAFCLPAVLVLVPRQRQLVTWLVVWYGVVMLAVFRLQLHLTYSPVNYQTNMLATNSMLIRFLYDFSAVGRYFSIPAALPQFWLPVAAAFCD